MPTNGVSEWVFPVLDSIFSQKCDRNKFEIIITDNGNNMEFKTKLKGYKNEYENIQYFETTALPFLNEIEAYRQAKGELIKFVNHRTKLVSGSLEKLIKYAEDNVQNKPVTYFTNGVLNAVKEKQEYDSFDDFVRNLSYWSSWSTGMTIWKSDFDRLPVDVSSFNELFPHTNVLFAERNRGKYVIDNSIIFDEIPQKNKPKGDYDLFFAFGVEYPAIILQLYRDNSISANTFKKVINDNLAFIAGLYIKYFIKKEYCSYNLKGLDDMYGIFYTKLQLQKAVWKMIFTKIIGKFFKK